MLMESQLSVVDFAARMGMALALGTLIGAEREWKQKLAGLKTNALVSVGAALFSALGFAASHGDPTRVAAQIASGIGFLGAGAILRDGLSIRGLTTAATVWCAAAVGALCGAGMLGEAAVGTLGIVSCNVALKELARKFMAALGLSSLGDLQIEVSFCASLDRAQQLREQAAKLIQEEGLEIRSVSLENKGESVAWAMTLGTPHGWCAKKAEDLSCRLGASLGAPTGWKVA